MRLQLTLCISSHKGLPLPLPLALGGLYALAFLGGLKLRSHVVSMMMDDYNNKNPPSPNPVPPKRHTTTGRSRVDTTGLPFMVVYGISSASACIAETVTFPLGMYVCPSIDPLRQQHNEL